MPTIEIKFEVTDAEHRLLTMANVVLPQRLKTMLIYQAAKELRRMGEDVIHEMHARDAERTPVILPKRMLRT